ncbi:unnamed protein product [Blepharisma stoltei]|uniref:PAS domain-containing protein n=1 Tax=Blepharisma stoltei TaxID=1481888 RepID=A0AAU9JNL6_9CILI|nr:unnamed protein product [Blepharisma stoltei]
MLSDNPAEILEGSKKLNYQEKLLNKWKIHIFKLFRKIFKSEYSKGFSMNTQLLVEIFINTLLSFQMIALAWYPDMDISEWNRYTSFWKFVSCFNLINVCSFFGIMDLCFYFIASILMLCFGALLLMLVNEFTELKIPKLLVKILRILFLVWTTLLYVPSLIELSIVFKYSTFNYDKVCELYGSHDPSLLAYGVLGTLVSPILIFFLIFLAFFQELFTADTRHGLWRKILTVRAHSSVDVKLLIFKTAMSISYVSFGNTEPIRFLVTFTIASFWIFLEFLRKWPYYNKFENCIKSCEMFSVCLSLFSVMLGKAMDNAGIIFMLNFFMQPISAIIVSWFLITKIANKKHSVVNDSNQYEFERSIRHLLCNKELEDKAQVINYFSGCYTNKTIIKDKLLVIWEVNFCSFSLKNQKLARIKLTKKKSIVPTLEGTIQELKAIKIIDKRDYSSTDSLYIEYLEELKNTKAHDFEVCCTLLDLGSELSASIPQYKKIHFLAIKSCTLLLELKDFYGKLIAKHKHLELYDLYITFLQNILGEFDQASSMSRLKASINHQLSFTTIYDSNISSFEDSGILLVSANENSFGTIAYINSKASQLLKGTISDLVGTDLHDYIPSVFSIDHYFIMKKFFIEYIDKEIAHQGQFFIQNSLGYLVECRFRISLSAFHNNAYFLVSISPITTCRQLALISEEGVIYNCTEIFSHYIGASTTNIKNLCISDFIPHLDISEMKPFEPLIIKKNEKNLAIVHTVKELRTKTIHMLLIIHDEKEINLWKVGKDISQIEYFKKIELSQKDLEKITQSSTFDFLDTKNQEFIPLISTSQEKQEEINMLIDEKPSKKYNNLNKTEEKSKQISVTNTKTTVASKHIEALSRKMKIFQKILLLSVIIT